MYFKVIVQWRGPILTIFVFFSHTYARWKGTGEPCPNFLWKSSKFSLHRFKKYFVFWYPYEPLFHLPYKVWTLTPWFRLWHFWTTVPRVTETILIGEKTRNFGEIQLFFSVILIDIHKTRQFEKFQSS